MVSCYVGEEADAACESGHRTPHLTISAPQCPPDPDLQGRVWLEADGVTGIHSDAPHKTGVRRDNSHYELMHTTHTEGVKGGGEGVRRTGEDNHIQEFIGVRSAPCQ